MPCSFSFSIASSSSRTVVGVKSLILMYPTRGRRLERPEHSGDRGVDELVRSGVFRSPGGGCSDEISLLFQALLHAALHRRANEAVAVESANKRRSGDSDQKRERKGPLVRLL